jgi:hypothetical protein
MLKKIRAPSKEGAPYKLNDLIDTKSVMIRIHSGFDRFMQILANRNIVFIVTPPFTALTTVVPGDAPVMTPLALISIFHFKPPSLKSIIKHPLAH